MGRVAGWVIVLVLLGGLAYCLFDAAGCAPPREEEIYALFSKELPEIPDDESAALSAQRVIRGWTVWLGTFPKYHRGQAHQIGERMDPENQFREIRFFRKASTAGAVTRNLWLTITGHAP